MAFISTNDVVKANNATFYATINGKRYEMLNAKDFTAVATVTTSDIPRLGTMIKGKVPNGLEIKLNFTVYKVSDMFDALIETYKNTGILPVFDCQVTNEGSEEVGRSTHIYKDCVINGDVMLNMLNAEGGSVEQSIEAYAADYSTNEKFNTPAYMM